ncbi:MAG: sugar ABC transporter substrate-binding protein [Planctomycetaceae bacterium]|nr:sugar ABC transporter substrate-binding protein [Planctomycetaceae bacterium]
MRKVAVMLLFAFALVVPFEATQAGEKKRVAYIARNLSDQFAAWLADEMKKGAEKYSDTFTLDIMDSQENNEKQNGMIENAIAMQYDCVIIQPNDGELQRPYAQKVLDAGIFCITTNARIPDLPGASSVDADPYEQGAALARDALKRVPENARVVLLSCMPGNLHTTSRFNAYHEEFLDKRPDVTLLAEAVSERPDEGMYMSIAEDWIQSYGHFDAALTVADAIALSFQEVVKDDPRFKNLITYGVDGLPHALLAVKDGKYTATVMQNCVDLATLNMKAAYELLTGQKEVCEYNISADFIDASNIDEYLKLYVQYGLLTQEEVDKHM